MPSLKVVAPAQQSPLVRLVDDYLAHCRAGGLSPKTVTQGYGYPLRSVFLPWCTENGLREPSQLTSRELDRLGAELIEVGGKRGELSRHSVWTYMKAVKRFLAWAKQEGETVPGEARLPKLPAKLVDILSREEVQLLEDTASNERDKLIVRLLADTGIRVGELVQLKPEDVIERDRNSFLRVHGKAERERLVPIAPTLQRRIRRYAQRTRPAATSSDRLFVALRARGGDYDALEASGVTQLIRDLGARAGLKKRVHPHLFRHSAATWMLRRGMNPLLVAQVLGHSSLQMIQKVYAHLSPTDAHQALMAALREE